MSSFDSTEHERHLAVLADLAARAQTHYDLPSGSTAGLLNLSENATYRIAAPDGRRWALRLHREGYQHEQAIASELAWADRPAAGRRGDDAKPDRRSWTVKLVQEHRPSAFRTRRHAVLFDWEAGVEPGIGDDLTGSFEALGETAARMHVHARQWRRPSWFTRHSWTFDTALGEERPHWGRWRDGVGMDREKEQLFQRTVRPDRAAARRLWHGRGALRPHPCGPAAGQPADRRRAP